MSLETKKMFNEKFIKLVKKLNDCYTWLDRCYTEINEGWDIVYTFNMLNKNVQELIYMYSDLFKEYSKSEKQTTALDEDLRNFLLFLMSRDLARALNEPKERFGEITMVISQMRLFLSYVKTVLEQTASEAEEKIPTFFVKHSLRNAGLVPKFEKIKELEKGKE